MKFTDFQSQTAAHQALIDEILQLEALRDSNSATLASLSVTCDLSDEAALSKITRLQTVLALIPARLEARENAFAQSAENLKEANGRFCAALRQKMASVREAAASEVKKVLSAHISNQQLLEKAVDQAESVRAIDGIFCTWDYRPEGALANALKLMESWQQVTNLEKAK